MFISAILTCVTKLMVPPSVHSVIRILNVKKVSEIKICIQITEVYGDVTNETSVQKWCIRHNEAPVDRMASFKFPNKTERSKVHAKQQKGYGNGVLFHNGVLIIDYKSRGQ